MLKRILITTTLTLGLAGAVTAPVLAETGAVRGTPDIRVVAPVPSFQVVPRPTQQPGAAVDQLFGILDPVGPAGPGGFTAAGGGLGDTQVCCDANDNCEPLELPGTCPAGTITSWCDEDNNCVDEDDDE